MSDDVKRKGKNCGERKLTEMSPVQPSRLRNAEAVQKACVGMKHEIDRCKETHKHTKILKHYAYPARKQVYAIRQA